MLTTYVQHPSIKHCQMVAESLTLKFNFLKESVSQNLQFFLLTFNLITRILESISYTQGVRTSIDRVPMEVRKQLLCLPSAVNLNQINMFMRHWTLIVMMMMCQSKEI